MTLKKFLFSIRNFKLLIIQFLIPALFIVLTMLCKDFLEGDQNLPGLAISLNEYLQTVTTVEKRFFKETSSVGRIFASYRQMFADLSSDHQLVETEEDFENVILKQYKASLAKTNLNYMVGASISANRIVAWFNNQGCHTAPLTINLINNAILK